MDNWGIVGHEWAVELLAGDLAAGRLRHAYLFTGAPGVGKRTLAVKFAQAINCVQPGQGNPPGPCGACRPCLLIAKGAHPDAPQVHSGVETARSRGGGDSQSLKIEQVRELERQVSLAPYEARYRTPLLLRFHEATPAAQNALLKTLEEPPPQVVLLLTADAPDLLLPTIVSRCQALRLRPLSAARTAQALQARGQDPERAELLAHLAGGRLGWAVRHEDDDDALERRSAQLAEMLALLNAPARQRRAYAESLAKLGRSAASETLELWQSWWRDVLLAASQAEAPLTNIDHAARIRQTAAAVEPAGVLRFMRALRETARAIERNANARLALEVLMFDLPGERAQPSS